MWQRRRQRALQAVNCARVAPVLRAVAMAREITQRELRNDSGEVMRALDRGESFLVTRNGVAVGELVPARRRRFVAASTAVAAVGPLPVGAEAARAYGRVYAAVARAGRKARGRRMADLLIAATAVSARLPLYTRNPKDFAHLEKIATIVPVDVHPSG